MARKKNLNDEDLTTATAEPIAKQTHVVTTRYTKTIPISETEERHDQITPDEEQPFTADPEYLISPHFVEEPPLSDPIQQMLADLQVEKKQHSWTMVVERLPNFERDGRYDVGSRRVNCGTRAMSENFVEDIRSEFARPNKPNHFRVTIKRDGKIYAHWPEVISLEPPPPDELPELEARFPALVNPADTTKANTGIDEFLKMATQFRKLQSLLMLEQNPAPAAPATEEAALLALLTKSPAAVQELTDRLAKRLFPDSAPGEGSEWTGIIQAAMAHGPALVEAIVVGIERLRNPAVASPSGIAPSAMAPVAVMSAAPVAPTPPMPEPGPSPEIVVLSALLRYLDMQAPPASAAVYLETFAQQHPTIEPLIESFLAMAPDEATRFISTMFPDATMLNAPHAVEWILQLQTALKGDQNDTV